MLPNAPGLGLLKSRFIKVPHEPRKIMYPSNSQAHVNSALYTYYAVTSLTVVTLAVSMIWIPFLQLIAELNTIIAKMLFYINKELLGNAVSCLNHLGTFISSQGGLTVISVFCLTYVVYLISGNFLLSAGCYVSHLPNHKCLQKLKKMVLITIEYLLNLSGNKGFALYGGNIAMERNLKRQRVSSALIKPK